jgi:hypothetical protein
LIMKIVQGDQVAPEPAVRHRGGGLQARILLEGTPGTLVNFQLSLGATSADFISPRHRHNFEQYRVVLDGRFDFGQDGVMTEGMVGYFPEGVYYGPQSSANNTLAAVLQFGGMSGGGYLSAQEVNAGMEELKQVGEFQKGVFRRREGVPGRKNQDAFEAIWEFVNGRPIIYPLSSYAGPAMMNPANLPWMPVDGAAGVSEKRLGSFAENRTGVRMLNLGGGASFEASGRGIYLVLSGAGTVAGEKLRRLTAFYVDAGETAALTAGELTFVLHYGLPAAGPALLGSVVDRAAQVE